MKKIAFRVALTVLFAALASCGGGGGGAPPSSPNGAPTVGEPRSTKTDPETSTVQGLVAQQADQAGGVASLRAQGAEGLELLENRIASNRRLFAYLPATLKIASIPNLNPSPGQQIAAGLLMPYVIGAGGYKYGIYASNLAYDAKRDRLYVPTNGGGIGILRNASAAAGEVQLLVYYVPTPMDTLGSVYLDVENDTLWFVSSTGARSSTISIAKIKSISNIEINSRWTIGSKAMAPVDFITVWHARSYTFTAGFAMDVKRSMIYMESGAVFDLNTMTPTPMTEPSSLISFPLDALKAYNTLPVRRFFDGSKFLTSVALDTTRDRLYFIDPLKKQLIIVDNASNAAEATTPVVLDLPGPVATYSALTIDPKKDRLYIGGAANDAYVVNDASAIRTGSTLPASHLFADTNPPMTQSEVWGIAIP